MRVMTQPRPDTTAKPEASPDARPWRALLGADLTALVEERATPVRVVEPIGRLVSPLSARAAFKLRLADGSLLKARRLESERRCATLADLAPLLEGLPFNRALAFRGAALLEQWIPGRPFADADATPQRLAEAGALLGRLHRLQLPATPRLATKVTPARLLRKVEAQLHQLCELALLSADDVSKLLVDAGLGLPETLETGLMHHDFCAENLIISAAGDLCVVDNENLRVGPLDADLARTFLRWPMNSRQRDAFSSGYRRYRSDATYRAHARFCNARARALIRVGVPGPRWIGIGIGIGIGGQGRRAEGRGGSRRMTNAGS
jgi:thiamine kinase-like enzyme